MKTLAFPRLLAFGLVMGSLVACASDQGQTGPASILKAAKTAFGNPLGAKDTPAATGIGITRASLANIQTPVDLVTIESRGAQGAIAKIGTNRGVETWSSVDNKTIALRGGVILATRGLGEDLMSASAPTSSQLLAGAAYQRVHTVLDGEDQPVHQRFDCRASRAGAETITVVERSYATQRITETCAGPLARFSNDYWFQSGEKLRKSRQWISKSVGFVIIEHLH